MTQEIDISEDIELIQDSGLFDADYYIANYKKELGKDKEPLEHFLYKGWQEGKNPSEEFNVNDYLTMYPETQEVGMNPLLHYLHEGKEKGYFPSRFAEQLEFVRKTGEFDEEYYFKNNKEVISKGEEPLHHFMRVGWKEERKPNRDFDFAYYRRKYEDVRSLEKNLFFHYLRFGKLEGRFSSQLAEDIALVRKSGLFDAVCYKEQVKGIAESEDPIEHFLRVGWCEGLNPSAEFNTKDYLAMYGKEVGDINPLLHYLQVGEGKGYLPFSSRFAEQLEFVRKTGEFDEEYYLEHNKEVIPKGEEPLHHFMRVGWKEERKPNKNFDFAYYREKYEDVKESKRNLFLHYLRFGKLEGRLPNQIAEDIILIRESGFFDAIHYRKQVKSLFATENPIEHFLRVGWKKGCNPAKFFDVKFYLDTYGGFDLNPFVHYLKFGVAKRRIPSPRFFDFRLPKDFEVDRYLELNPDLDSKSEIAKEKAMWHYLKLGKKEGRAYKFDFYFYTKFHPDLSRLKTESKAINHWVANGKKEGRYTNLDDYLESIGTDPKQFSDILEGSKLQEMNPDMDVASPLDSLIAVLHQDPPILLRFFDNDEYNGSFYFQLAYNFEKSQALVKAVDTYHMALMFKSDWRCHENLGNIALNQERYHEAIEHYSEAISLKPKSIWSHINLNKSLAKLGKHDRVVEVIIDAIENYPLNPSLLQITEDSINSYWRNEDEKLSAIAKCSNRKGIMSATESAVNTVSKLYRCRFMVATENIPRVKINTQNVLIVGDFYLPQCLHYRIEQKQEQLEEAGFEVSAVPWTKSEDMQNEILWNDIIIFYRVPALPSVVKIMEQARSLGKLTFYEIDDLIFDPIYPPEINSYGGKVGPSQYLGLVKGMALMHEAAKLCDYAIASTKPLLEKLESLVHKQKGFLHRNALDSLNWFVEPTELDKDGKDNITIFYGSGTLAHNSDFILEVLPAIERIMENYKAVNLVVAGYLKLPESFTSKYKKQIMSIPFTDNLKTYWYCLSGANINIAVLHKDIINNCKSELKWFEAACFGIPSVVSATQNYLDVIQDGVDGFIASSIEQWYDSLEKLITDSKLRKQVGLNALNRVRNEYSISNMAENISSIIEEALKDFESGHCIHSAQDVVQGVDDKNSQTAFINL